MKLPKNYKIKYKGTHMGQCHRCRQTSPVKAHHLLYGKNRRKFSDHFDLVRDLCVVCHDELHNRNSHLAERYKLIGQKDFEERCGTRDEFIEIFGRAYDWYKIKALDRYNINNMDTSLFLFRGDGWKIHGKGSGMGWNEIRVGNWVQYFIIERR